MEGEKKGDREKRKAVLDYISQNTTLHNNINHSPVDLRGHDDSGVNKVGWLMEKFDRESAKPPNFCAKLLSHPLHLPFSVSTANSQSGSSRDLWRFLPSHVSLYDISIGGILAGA